MKLTPTRASSFIWIVTASLFVVLAIFAGYAIFFRHHTTPHESACRQAQQAKHVSGTSDQLSIADAICAGTTQ